MMSLSPSTTLGPYAITAKIGEGGMGEVWQARDTKLDRDVALKVLSHAFTDDPDRLARFEREAKVLASLNHPNIGHIYGLEEAEGQKALVLELIEGPTLADRIARGPIPVDEALPIATQIAEALEAAHEQGIIHRDLKPANIKVKDDGTVKVLDFGLAKAFQPDASDVSASLSPTISLTAAATQMGMVIGTAAYMAPEQASGKPVDKRADVWAFGAVLYEMLAGARPFVGDDLSKTLARVIDRDPDWGALPKNLSPLLVAFLRQCLEKDPKNRVRDIGDVSLVMRGAFETTVGSDLAPTASTTQTWSGMTQLVALGLALLLGGAYLGWAFWGANTQPITSRFTLTLPDGERLRRGAGDLVAVSADGQTIVYVAYVEGGSRIYRRPINQFQATPVADTEGGTGPFLSPDGQWIGFVRDGALLKASLAGGPAQTLTDVPSPIRGADWGADDTIVYGENTVGGSLMRIPAAGGEPTTLFTTDDDRRVWYPQVLAGGDAVLFTLSNFGVDQGELRLLMPATGEHRTLLPSASKGRVLSSGHLTFVRSGALWAVRFDLSALEVVGTPVPVVERVRVEGGGAVQYAAADDGSLVYLPGTVQGVARSLVWVDRNGTEEVLELPVRDYETLSLSPDGTRAAVVAGGADGNRDIWVSDLARGTLTRLTTDTAVDTAPLWSPDGRRVMFTSVANGQEGVYSMASDGSGTPELLLSDDEISNFVPYDWSPDGNQVFLTAESAPTDRDVGMVTLDGSGEWEPLVDTPAREQSPALSPDGRWLAYASGESNRYEVYVQRFPELAGRQQVSVGSGYRPQWSSDGRELFYLRAPVGPPTEVIRVTVEGTGGDPPVLAFGEEEVLFDWRYYSQASPLQYYDMSPDGQRFLLITSGGAEDSLSAREEINVVRNWSQELRERVPVP